LLPFAAMRLFRWICTKSNYDLCQDCHTKLATEQLDAKRAEAKSDASNQQADAVNEASNQQ
jgi:cytochrome c oxidase assembly protein Cox11